MSKKPKNVSNKAGKLMRCDGQMLKKIIEAKGYKCHELSKMLRYCSDYLTTCCRTNKISDVAVKYLMDYKIFPQMYGVEGEIKVDDIVSPTEVEIDKDEKKIEFGTPYGIVRSEKDLQKYIRQALTKGPHWGTDLMTMRDILNKARANGLSYDVEDMRKDMFVYASNLVDGDSKKWMHFVNHLNLKYDPTDQEIDVSEDVKKYVESDKKATEELQKKIDIKSDKKTLAQEAKEILNEMYGTRNMGVNYGYGPSPKYPSYVNASQKIAEGLYQLMEVAMNDLKHDPEFKEMIKQAVKEAYEEL